MHPPGKRPQILAAFDDLTFFLFEGFDDARDSLGDVIDLLRRLMDDNCWDQLLEFNELLVALNRAGVPLRLSRSADASPELLRQLSEGMRLRARLGQPVPKALEDDPDLPEVYRWAVQAGLETGKWSTALESLSRPAKSDFSMRKSLGLSMVQPVLVLVLAYLGFLFLCAVFVPEIAATYEQMRTEPSLPAQILIVAHETMPVWGPAFPVVFLLVLLWWTLFPQSTSGLFSGRTRYQLNIRRATVADLAATLVETGVPQATAMRVASLASEDFVHNELPGHTTAADADATLTTASHRNLPPLAACALAMPYSAETTPQFLRVAASTYRSRANAQAKYWHNAVPTMLAAALGGMIVLLYGISVFGTMSQLLQDIAR